MDRDIGSLRDDFLGRVGVDMTEVINDIETQVHNASDTDSMRQLTSSNIEDYAGETTGEGSRAWYKYTLEKELSLGGEAGDWSAQTGGKDRGTLSVKFTVGVGARGCIVYCGSTGGVLCIVYCSHD
jgi:hypothetical protein